MILSIEYVYPTLWKVPLTRHLSPTEQGFSRSWPDASRSIVQMWWPSRSWITPDFLRSAAGIRRGRAKKFESDQVAGINELVLDFALPASLFVGTVRTPRDQLLQQGPLVLALLIGIVGLYVIVLLLGRQLFRHPMGVAALQAITVCFSAGPYFGPAVLTPVYGASSAVAISMIAIILNIVIVPMTLVLIEISRETESSAAKSIASLVGPALVNAVKTPFVWAPLLAVALVLVGVSVPPLVDSALSLIGQATGGVALFVAGLMIAAHKVIFNLEVGVNTVLKMLVQPAVFFLLALAFGVKPPFLYEGLLLTALPSGPMGILLATRNKMYESDASSALAVTSVAMLITLPIILYLIGAAR
jgi:malonate transporter